MKILALDTSAIVATAALIEDETMVAEFTINYKKTHSQTIMPMVENICQTAEISLDTIDYIAVASGPGSFTGLRIGAATAKGLAHGLDKPIVAVPTLDGLAMNILDSTRLICPIMDAKRGQVYTGIYRWGKGALEVVTAPMAISIEELLMRIREMGESVIFLGDGVPVHKEKIKSSLPEYMYIFAPAHLNMHRAGAIGVLAAQYVKEGKIQDYAEFSPIYLRKPQAEREYEERNSCGKASE